MFRRFKSIDFRKMLFHINFIFFLVCNSYHFRKSFIFIFFASIIFFIFENFTDKILV